MEDSRFDISGRTVMVVGLNVTGLACANTLPPLGARVIVTDTRTNLDQMRDAIEKVEKAGAVFMLMDAALQEYPDILVVSPGLSPKDERVMPVRAVSGEWMSEIELASRLCKGRIIAVTGTNGKTTVTTLIGEILKKAFADVRVAGNIGEAFIEAAVGSTEETIFVIEVSSYQLEGCTTFRPDVAVVLNIQPDHSMRHPTLEIYADVKARMLASMTAEGSAVLNFDDARVAAMKEKTNAKIVPYGTEKELEEGASVIAGGLVMRMQGTETVFIRNDELQLKGTHNTGNVLAAAAASSLIGADRDIIHDVCAAFTGLAHRIEPVATVSGIECVNDSKGTNPDSTLAALAAYEGRDVTLIMNGDDKGFDYGPLYKQFARKGVRVIVMGPGLARVDDELNALGGIEHHKVPSMAEAVRLGLETTPKGGVLLLSPGSSSFDLYRNYMERGEDFRNEVKNAG